MRTVLKTKIHHATHANGTIADCCGCWHLILDSEAEWPIQALCNECDEVRDLGRHELDP